MAIIARKGNKMENVWDFLKAFNLQTILSLAGIVWYFTRDIKSSINNLDHDLREMNTRISRIEGTVYGKEIYNKVDK